MMKGMYMLVYAYMDRQGGKVDRHMHVYARETHAQTASQREADRHMHACMHTQ